MIKTVQRKLRKMNHYPVEWVVVIGSFFLSLIFFLHQESVNRDGVLYIETARAFLTQGIKAGFAVYSWPFYSFLIGIISRWTTWSLLTTAYVMNTLFMAGICFLFIKILQQLTSRRFIHWLGCIVILVHPYFNHLRADVLRDFGYLFF